MYLTDEHIELKTLVRRIADEKIQPLSVELDETGRFPIELYKQLGELGLFGVCVPEKYGGPQLDVLSYAIVMEELSRGYASVADQCGLVELITTLLVDYGTEEQCLKYLRNILSLKTLVAYCITEPEAGTDVSNIRTKAEKIGDGWLLNGHKIWIHNAPIADLGFVLAKTNPNSKHHGMSVLIVDLNSKGVTKGKKEKKLGQSSSQVGTLTFDNVKLPKDALLGEEGEGFQIMMRVLNKGRVGIAALAVGIAQSGLELALDYAHQRKQFGREIAKFQGMQWLIADMAKDIEAARLLVHSAATKIDNGENATNACSMAKCFASDIAVARTSDAIQVFGGSGYIRGFIVERLYRDAKITQIYEGTNQIQRSIIFREIARQRSLNQ